jgi:hypothetical protein
MSMAEIKHAVDELSQDDQLELAHYLRQRSLQNDPEWAAELARRLDRLKQGKGYSREDLLAIHNRLIAEGK